MRSGLLATKSNFRLAYIVISLISLVFSFSNVAAQIEGEVVDSESVFVWRQKNTGISPPAQLPAPTQPPVVPVIVRLDMAYTPEPQLPDATAIQTQRQMIDQVQTALIAGMNQGNMGFSGIKRFTTLPYMAMTIAETDVNRMRNLPEARLVSTDDLVSIQTNLANPIVGADIAIANGFDGTGYAVAVLDTGVDFTHPALINQRVAEACFTTDTSGQIVPGMNGTFSQVVSGCPDGETVQIGDGAAAPFSPGDAPDDCNFCGHGSHVAGIAAGNGGDAFQGVAPGAGIIGINVFSIFTNDTFCLVNAGEGAPCTLGYTSDQILAFEYVLSLSETVSVASVNLSLGGGLFSSEQTCDASDFLGYLNAVDTLRAANIAVIAAAGNDGAAGALSRPACYSNIVSVGATSVAGSAPAIATTDGVAAFSNSTPFMDFWAPGLIITSSEPVERYVQRAGTSMASPYIAGAWAVMRQAYPTDSVEQIQDKLASTGTPVQDPRNGVVKPRLQLDTALPEQISPTCPADVNADGIVTPSDAVWVINQLEQSVVTLDLDQSGQVDEADVQFVLDRLGEFCDA